MASTPTTHAYVKLLGLKPLNTPGLLRLVRSGLAYGTWERFLRTTGLPSDPTARVVQISPRTLSRRKEEGRLRPDESDRLLRVARIVALARDLFGGDMPAARKWLLSRQPALGGAVPLDCAATDPGTREVEALIGRLEHGIPA